MNYCDEIVGTAMRIASTRREVLKKHIAQLEKEITDLDKQRYPLYLALLLAQTEFRDINNAEQRLHKALSGELADANV